jgi:23S rRNA (cytidine1920-2'-O)/16S rRNA (cytidine1409-2'-O)-methyltransferase
VPNPRLDVLLVERGLAPSRERARRLVMAGEVLVDGVPAAKPGTPTSRAATIDVRAPARAFVSRGGEKLAGALDAFGIDPTGWRVLDVGASTGGFTDCLLQRGARRVVAVDVGYGQLAWSLRTDPRVEVHERTNARHLAPDFLDEPVDLAVVDVSFISLRLVLPALAPLVRPGGGVLALVKPNFEVGRDRVGAGGVVRDPAVRAAAVRDVVAAATAQGLHVRGEVASPLVGPKGNRETFVWLER